MNSVAHAEFSVETPTAADFGVSDLWAPRFPSSVGLDLAAKLFDARPAWKGEEGPRPRLVIAAGSFAIAAPDLARQERRWERAEKARQVAVDIAATYLANGEEVPEPVPCREITGWSRKSRANMVRALCELDYEPMLSDPTRLPAMVTLTYPGDWRAVAPNGKEVKRHLRAFRRRYERAWGQELRAVWKLEFQARGAPHFHLLMVPPHGAARQPGPRATAAARVGAGLPFPQWLSIVWADIVAADDIEACPERGTTERQRHLVAGTNTNFSEGLKASDPKRVAVYFTKHGTFAAKEYQNCVPEEWREPGAGPGRFWGYWHLERVTAQVEVTPEDAARAARIARRWARAQGTTRQTTVVRTRGGRPNPSELVVGIAGARMVLDEPRVRRRRVRRRVRRLSRGRGFISVNDGQMFAIQLARALSIQRP